MIRKSGRRFSGLTRAITRQDIAEMTGTTLHTVSRLLTAWEHQGLVRSTRKHVTVIDARRLLDHVGRS